MFALQFTPNIIDTQAAAYGSYDPGLRRGAVESLIDGDAFAVVNCPRRSYDDGDDE